LKRFKAVRHIFKYFNTLILVLSFIYFCFFIFLFISKGYKAIFNKIFGCYTIFTAWIRVFQSKTRIRLIFSDSTAKNMINKIIKERRRSMNAAPPDPVTRASGKEPRRTPKTCEIHIHWSIIFTAWIRFSLS
jgi:hypothetical protein